MYSYSRCNRSWSKLLHKSTFRMIQQFYSLVNREKWYLKIFLLFGSYVIVPLFMFFCHSASISTMIYICKILGILANPLEHLWNLSIPKFFNYCHFPGLMNFLTNIMFLNFVFSSPTFLRIEILRVAIWLSNLLFPLDHFVFEKSLVPSWFCLDEEISKMLFIFCSIFRFMRKTKNYSRTYIVLRNFIWSLTA